MVKFQTKRKGENSQHEHTPYLQTNDHTAAPVRFPVVAGPSTVNRVSDFLAYDEDTQQDPYTLTKGTTGGYQPTRDDATSAGKRRGRGNAYNGIYLDEPVPRLHERRNPSAQHDARRFNALEQEQAYFGSEVVQEAADFYHGASHAPPERDPREPRTMSERFMTKVEKYETDWEKKNNIADMVDAGRSQLEQAAYSRSRDRQRDREAGEQLKRYDPWGTGGDHDPRMRSELSQATDYGTAEEIPAPDAKKGHLLENPYFDPTAERHQYVTFDAGTVAAYQDKWLEQGDPDQKKSDHRKVVALGEMGGPTTGFSQAEMVRMRYKEAAAGLYTTHEAHHKVNYLSGNLHYTDTGVSGPPVVNGVDLHSPQHNRSKNNDFDSAGREMAKMHPDIEFGHHVQPEAGGRASMFKGEHNSLNSYTMRNMPFSKDRPNQTWN